MNWNFSRWLRHEFTSARAVRKVLAPEAMTRVGALVTQSEKRHSGEIRLVVEASLTLPFFRPALSARERAVEVFSSLHIWDTEANNGVLIYLLLADRDVEIVADRGINQKVGAAGWESICQAMETAFRAGKFEDGLRVGIERVTAHLEQHFPLTNANRFDDRNELPDAPILLG
jgi:uncharacterized membrane protein